MTIQTDADLIREAKALAKAQRSVGLVRAPKTLDALVARIEELTQPAPQDTRSCTCHPDDNPPVPCARQYAYSECVKAAQPAPQPSADDAALAAQIMSDCGCSTNNERLLERIMQRIAAHTEQPAPLALSAEDAQAWDQYVRLAKQPKGPQNNPVYDRAILAVDALLRKRVTPLTDEQIGELIDKCRADIEQEFLVELVRAAEQAHGIGEGAK